MRRFAILPALLLLLTAALPAQVKPAYEKKATRLATLLAALKANGLPTLEGKWHYVGPFDNTDKVGFDAVYHEQRPAHRPDAVV